MFTICIEIWRLNLNYYFAACESEAIGLASSAIIPDNSFSASSYFSNEYKPSFGRLNGTNRGWGPKTTINSADYLQIDLLYEYVICAVATQGANGIDEWTTNYKIQSSMDGITTVTYQETNVEKVDLHEGHAQIYVHIKKAKDIWILERWLNFWVKRWDIKEVYTWSRLSLNYLFQ